MFEGLKSKLQNIQKKFGRSIEEAAGPDVVVEAPSPVPQPEVGRPAVVPDTLSSATVPKPEKKAEGFVAKVRSLIIERELIISEKDIVEPLEELEMALLENDVALDVSDAIIGYMKEDLVGSHRKIGTSVDTVVTAALRGALLRVLGEGFDPIDYVRSHERPVKILITGVNGTGKTTSIAKMAHYFKKNGFSVVLGAGDTFRAGAIDQIAEHATRLGVKVIQHQEGSDPAAVLYDTVEYAKAHEIDVVLADTAGRFHNRKNLMNQLDKIRRVMKPDLVVYVDEAVAGNDAVVRAKDFNDLVGTDAVMLTKADMDPRGGAAISIAQTIGKPILFLGTGQGYDDIVPFRPERVVDELVGAEG
jgi:fused signal recognition particle receptor